MTTGNGVSIIKLVKVAKKLAIWEVEKVKKVLRVIRIIFGIEFALVAVAGVVMSIQSPMPENIAATVFCAVIAVLLLRKQKEKPQVWGTSVTVTPVVTVKTERTPPEVPQDILRDMRKYYSKMQAENDARIMADSFRLCQQTLNYGTFFERYELAQQKALTLLQAQQARCRIDFRMIKAANSVLSAASSLKIDFLERIYAKEITAAQRLKTQNGINNRLQKFIDELQEYETDFMVVEDVYKDVIQRVKAQIS